MAFSLKVTKANLEEAKGGTFEPIPEGIYGATIFEAKVGPSKTSGNPMYTITYSVEHGAKKPRKVKGYHIIQGPGSFSTNNLLKALGRPVPEKAGDFEYPDADELIGEELNVKIKMEPYETINQDTGEEETRHSNSIAGTFPFDESRHSTNEDAEEAAAPGGKLL